MNKLEEENIQRILNKIKEDVACIFEKYTFNIADKITADSIRSSINNMICNALNDISIITGEFEYFKIDVEITDDIAKIIPNNFWSALLMFGIYVPYLFLEIKKIIKEDGKLELFDYENIKYSYNIETKELKYLPIFIINNN
jgi:hypothetical protein